MITVAWMLTCSTNSQTCIWARTVVPLTENLCLRFCTCSQIVVVQMSDWHGSHLHYQDTTEAQTWLQYCLRWQLVDCHPATWESEDKLPHSSWYPSAMIGHWPFTHIHLVYNVRDVRATSTIPKEKQASCTFTWACGFVPFDKNIGLSARTATRWSNISRLILQWSQGESGYS